MLQSNYDLEEHCIQLEARAVASEQALATAHHGAAAQASLPAATVPDQALAAAQMELADTELRLTSALSTIDSLRAQLESRDCACGCPGEHR